MDKRVEKIIKTVNDAQDKVRKLVKGKAKDVSAGIRRATAFLELAKGEIEDFRRQFRPAAKPQANKRKKKKGK